VGGVTGAACLLCSCQLCQWRLVCLKVCKDIAAVEHCPGGPVLSFDFCRIITAAHVCVQMAQLLVKQYLPPEDWLPVLQQYLDVPAMIRQASEAPAPHMARVAAWPAWTGGSNLGDRLLHSKERQTS
jgi:hypothetical protein